MHGILYVYIFRKDISKKITMVALSFHQKITLFEKITKTRFLPFLSKQKIKIQKIAFKIFYWLNKFIWMLRFLNFTLFSFFFKFHAKIIRSKIWFFFNWIFVLSLINVNISDGNINARSESQCLHKFAFEALPCYRC